MFFGGNHRIGPETERLIHRALNGTDAEAFFQLDSHAEVLNLERVVAFTMPTNLGSIHVLEKTGFIRQEPVIYDGEPTEYFVLEASHYRQDNV